MTEQPKQDPADLAEEESEAEYYRLKKREYCRCLPPSPGPGPSVCGFYYCDNCKGIVT